MMAVRTSLVPRPCSIHRPSASRPAPGGSVVSRSLVVHGGLARSGISPWSLLRPRLRFTGSRDADGKVKTEILEIVRTTSHAPLCPRRTRISLICGVTFQYQHLYPRKYPRTRTRSRTVRSHGGTGGRDGGRRTGWISFYSFTEHEKLLEKNHPQCDVTRLNA